MRPARPTDAAPGNEPVGSVRRYTDDADWQELAGYSRAVRSADLIAVSGTTSSAPDGQPTFPGDTYRQALDAAQRCVRAVEALGGSVTDTIRTRVLLAPGATWQDAARAHKEVFDDARPANTMLFVGGLIGDGLLVEIEVEAKVANGDRVTSTPARVVSDGTVDPAAGSGHQGGAR